VNVARVSRSPKARAASGGPVLSARGLAAGYHGRAVIEDVNIELRAGQVLALLGANGAGKTTTLLSLAGEVKPLRGTVEQGGRATTAPLHVRARRGMRLVTEDRSVFLGLSAADNLRLAHRDIGPCVQLFPELEPLLGRRTGLLSGGEQQMLTLARALVGQPSVILIDELSLGLAPIIVKRLAGAVRAAADCGCAVLLVEQQTRHALEIADRACVMRRGRIVLEGEARELLADTARIEASYLGER
jgi:branched-chain amino acid transport system ATP-binding protein